eukprot:scaffold1482_cov120-Cylindrotheca_fusiformis.AAC.17
MEGSGDDTRKKRQVDPSEEEKPKKVRVENSPTKARRLLVATATPTSQAPDADVVAPSHASVNSPIRKPKVAASKIRSNPKVWDMESALLYLVQVEGDFKEYLSHDQSTWVTFRAGHAGDASAIASWYRRDKQLAEEKDEEENPELDKQPVRARNAEEAPSSMLEVWLADGMGDEGNPPSCFSLIADVHKVSEPTESDTKESPKPSPVAKPTKTMGAAALLTIAFVNNERVLRVEWMRMHTDLAPEVATILQQRMWLRLSTLSVMTACQLVEVDLQHTIKALDTSEEGISKAPRFQPSAE